MGYTRDATYPGIPEESHRAHPSTSSRLPPPHTTFCSPFLVFHDIYSSQQCLPVRICGHKNSVWSKEWNRIAGNSVKAELQVRLNVTEAGAAFANFFNMYSLGKELVKAEKEKNYIIGRKADILLLPQMFTRF
jgi:hypothetical protein